MLFVHFHFHVKAEFIGPFKEATVTNAKSSLDEPGVIRFDVVQADENPAHFVLVEIYRDAAANAAHKETAHYRIWRDTVAPMMAEPRQSVKFTSVFP